VILTLREFGEVLRKNFDVGAVCLALLGSTTEDELVEGVYRTLDSSTLRDDSRISSIIPSQHTVELQGRFAILVMWTKIEELITKLEVTILIL